MSGDPLRLVWDALDARGCRPHGKQYDFRARCPGHGGDNKESLHVTVGADGRVVLWCFARQCPAEQIAAAVGLSVADLFPDGHHRGRRLPLKPVRRADFDGTALHAVNVLYALEQLDVPWQGMVGFSCPACGSPGCWLRASTERGVDADCPDGCDAGRITGALLGLLRERRAS